MAFLKSSNQIRDTEGFELNVVHHAAVHGEYAAPPNNGHLYTEEDWNETSSFENGQAYHLSKVAAGIEVPYLHFRPELSAAWMLPPLLRLIRHHERLIYACTDCC